MTTDVIEALLSFISLPLRFSLKHHVKFVFALALRKANSHTWLVHYHSQNHIQNLGSKLTKDTPVISQKKFIKAKKEAIKTKKHIALMLAHFNLIASERKPPIIFCIYLSVVIRVSPNKIIFNLIDKFILTLNSQ